MMMSRVKTTVGWAKQLVPSVSVAGKMPPVQAPKSQAWGAAWACAWRGGCCASAAARGAASAARIAYLAQARFMPRPRRW